MKTWRVEAKHHTYINLYYGEQFIYCFDNDIMRFSFIKSAIENRTKMKWEDIEKVGEFTGFGEYGHSGEKYCIFKPKRDFQFY